MRLKVFIWLLLPLAALVGTWIGYAAAGVPWTASQFTLLILLGCWTICGFCVYGYSERSKMNRSCGYH